MSVDDPQRQVDAARPPAADARRRRGCGRCRDRRGARRRRRSRRRPISSRTELVGSERAWPPMRKTAGSPRLIDRTGQAKSASSASRCRPIRAVGDVVIDEAAVRVALGGDQRAPDRQHRVGDRRPGCARRVAVDVAVARSVGEPAIAAGRGHRDAHRLAPGGQRREGRRGGGTSAMSAAIAS